jgi:hypothetical protein
MMDAMMTGLERSLVGFTYVFPEPIVLQDTPSNPILQQPMELQSSQHRPRWRRLEWRKFLLV